MASTRNILPPPVDVTLYSDASNHAWGGHTSHNVSTGGDWNESEQLLHINILELTAAYFTLLSFCREQHNVHIRLTPPPLLVLITLGP